ncbi:MAG: membrane associated rhomboid family serine protease [Phycisphaerales bacterium]
MTSLLIGSNVLIHAVMVAIRGSDPELANRILDRLAVVGGSRFEWFQLLSSAFLHGGILHLAGNMVFLYAFGRALEDRLGWLKYLVFYLLAAAASGGAHIAFENSPAIGASGAIAGVTGAFLVLFPRTRIKCFYILGGIILAPAWWIIGLGMAWNLLMINNNDNIARVAHLGGYAFGFAAGMGLLWLKLVPHQPYDLFTTVKQANRRRQIKAAMASTAARPINRPDAPRVADPQTEALAKARAKVSLAISGGDLDAAVEAYRALCAEFPDSVAATTLSRNAQYRLANHLYAVGLYDEAAAAWTRFLEVYHKDAEADGVRVLLARILADHVGQPEQARQQLQRVIDKGTNDEMKTIAQDDFAELCAEFPRLKETKA